jgi:hypothetical protein
MFKWKVKVSIKEVYEVEAECGDSASEQSLELFMRDLTNSRALIETDFEFLESNERG